jgi:RNA polymerase sigma-70 factor (ECF subfamily)
LESDLIRRARAGDHLAQDQIAREHRRAMYLLALQMLRNPEDAMDVVQDSLLRFFKNLHRFDPDRPVKPWLFQIVRNRARDILRRRKVRKHDSIDDRDDEGNLRFELLDPKADPERDTQAIRLQAHLWKTLDLLSENQREILILRDYQDLSYAEIAETLKIPIGTVMSRLHGARKKLRGHLESDLESLYRC